MAGIPRVVEGPEDDGEAGETGSLAAPSWSHVRGEVSGRQLHQRFEEGRPTVNGAHSRKIAISEPGQLILNHIQDCEEHLLHLYAMFREDGGGDLPVIRAAARQELKRRGITPEEEREPNGN